MLEISSVAQRRMIAYVAWKRPLLPGRSGLEESAKVEVERVNQNAFADVPRNG